MCSDRLLTTILSPNSPSPSSTQQQAAPEEASRSLDPTDASAGEDSGAAIYGSGRKSLRKSALSAVTSLAGGLFGLDGQLPKFEETARELVHPLFEKLKTQVGMSKHRSLIGGGGKWGCACGVPAQVMVCSMHGHCCSVYQGWDTSTTLGHALAGKLSSSVSLFQSIPLCFCATCCTPVLQVWELVPAALQESLQEIVGERAGDTVAEADVSDVQVLQ